MKKFYFILAIVIGCVIITFNTQANNSSKEIRVETRKIETKAEIPIVDLRESQREFPSGIEKGVDFVVNNINNMNGWSFTGYAKTSLDEEFRIQRWKFGIINAEIYDFETQLYYRKNHLFTEYEHEPKSVIFGIAFNKEF